MSEIRTRQVTRNQIVDAVGNNTRLIKLIEGLTADVGVTLPADVQSAQSDIDAIKLTHIITPLDAEFGAVGDGKTDDYAAWAKLLDSLRLPGLNLSTSAAAKASIRGLPRVTVDLVGKTYLLSQKLDFGDLYNVRFVNGVLLASRDATWSSDPMLYIAKPQATNIYHDQRIRFLTFQDITVDGNGVANLIYLENAFCVTFERVYGLGWPNGGKGLWTCDSSTPPNKSNTNLRIKDCVFFQQDASEITPKNAQPDSSGTCVSLKTADFFIDGLVCAYADVLLELDNFYNGQVSNFHPYCKSYEKCLVLGPGAHHVGFSNIYFDTGIVELRSFDHTFDPTCHFLAGADLKLIATTANESMAGLDMRGLFGSVPQYLTEGAGSWSVSFKGRITGRTTSGSPIPSRGSEVLGRQSALHASLSFSDDSGADYDTGLFSPGPNMMGYTLGGTEQWRFNDAGRWLLGSEVSVLTGQSAEPRMQIHGSIISDATFSVTRWSNSSAAQSQVVVAKSRSTTPGTFSALQAGDYIGRFAFCGDNGVSLNPVGAAIVAKANTTWTNSNASTTLTIQVAPNGSLTPEDCWEVRQNKHLVPSVDSLVDIGEAPNQVRKIYAKDAVYTGTVTFPGPYANDFAAAAGGVAIGGAYRVTGGNIAWRQV